MPLVDYDDGDDPEKSTENVVVPPIDADLFYLQRFPAHNISHVRLDYVPEPHVATRLHATVPIDLGFRSHVLTDLGALDILHISLIADPLPLDRGQDLLDAVYTTRREYRPGPIHIPLRGTMATVINPAHNRQFWTLILADGGGNDFREFTALLNARLGLVPPAEPHMSLGSRPYPTTGIEPELNSDILDLGMLEVKTISVRVGSEITCVDLACALTT